MKKRILTMLLALVMVLSFVPAFAMATEATTSNTLGDGFVNTADGKTFVTLEAQNLNATSSVVLKLYSGETHIATTTLQNNSYFNYSQLSVKFCIVGTSSSWKTEWVAGHPRADYIPNKAVLIVDDEVTATSQITVNNRDVINGRSWSEVPGVHVASVGDNYYTSLSDAINAAEGGEVKVLGDVTLTQKNEITVEGKNITITADAPVTITTDEALEAFYVKGSSAVLTLGNNIKITSDYGAVLEIAEGGTINVDGAIIDVVYDTNKVCNAVAWINVGTLNMKSGSISGKGADTSTIAAVVDGGVVNITGGAVTSENSSAIAARNGAEVTISGGTVTSGTGFGAFASGGATITVSGGTVNSTGNKSAALLASMTRATSGGKVIVTGGTVGGVKAHEAADAEATISGGTITGPVSTGDVGSLSISGGTFSTAPETTYLANGFEVKDNGDGTYGVQEIEEDPVVGLAQFESTSMVLEENIDIRFWIKKADLDTAGATYAVVAFNGRNYTVNKAAWVDKNDGYYRIPFVDVAAKQMCDEITITVYNTNGEEVSNTLTYTVGKAIVATHNNEDNSAMKELCVSLLNYGTAAQKAFNYKTDDLASKYLNDLQGQNG